MIPDPESLKVSNGVVKIGDSVSAANASGLIVEGNVFALQSYGHPEVDATWDQKGTVIIRDHESKRLSHWRPSLVTKL